MNTLRNQNIKNFSPKVEEYAIPNIVFVNHASYILSYKNIKILVDPWFSGSAFDNGWSLLVNNYLKDDEIKNITHIWYSHEHPDHFSVSDLRHIFQINPNIEILFQETNDKRVVNFCKKIGFEYRELANFKITNLAEDFTIQVVKCGLLDSLSIMNFENKCILNLNDCIPNEEMFKLKKLLLNNKKQIVLFTQFSYAEKAGNPNQPEKRDNAAKRKFKQIRQQIEIFRPDFIIPFASHIFFSNKENYYLNDKIVKIEDVQNYVKNNFSYAHPVVLYPGEKWLFTKKSNTNSIEQYRISRKNIKVLYQDPKVSLEELVKEFEFFRERVFSKNNFYLIFLTKLILNMLKKSFIPKIHFLIKDHYKVITLDLLFGSKLANIQNKNIDIEINSHSLLYSLKHEWGGSTLKINGKFITHSNDAEKKLSNFFFLPTINSTGKTLFRFLLDRILLKKYKKIDDFESSFFKK